MGGLKICPGMPEDLAINYCDTMYPFRSPPFSHHPCSIVSHVADTHRIIYEGAMLIHTRWHVADRIAFRPFRDERKYARPEHKPEEQDDSTKQTKQTKTYDFEK
jgi:hypothetical protein